MTDEPEVQGSALVKRATNIILRPRMEWLDIDEEATSIEALFKSYAMILALIPAAADVIGGLQGYRTYFWFTYHPSLIGVLLSAAVSYAINLGLVYLLGLLIDALAPSFGAARNPIGAMKVAVYSMTAVWLAGVFAIVPVLYDLQILGCYSIYLFCLGLPRIMKPPPERTTGYIVVVVVLFLIASAVASGLETSIGQIGAAPHRGFGLF